MGPGRGGGQSRTVAARILYGNRVISVQLVCSLCSPSTDHAETMRIKCGDCAAHGSESQVQSTLVISKSKRPAETLRDIRTSTYQMCRIEENTKRTTKFHT